MLYLVATPIGNLDDITLRALETLRTVDFVASEDTRKTGRLLQHFAISKPQIAFHEHNEHKAIDRIVGLLQSGKSVALVTDAGTPGIADPGFVAVRRALAEDLPVTMIPGPTGLIMALVLSGLPLHSFTFRGFPPRKSGQRQRFLAVDQDAPHTLIFYESPYRLLAFLDDALAVYGDRPAVIANDLTKLYEQLRRGTLKTLRTELDGVALKGEFIVVIEGERGEGERSKGERSKGERSEGERSEGERSEGERSEGERSEGQRSEGERSEGECSQPPAEDDGMDGVDSEL